MSQHMHGKRVAWSPTSYPATADVPEQLKSYLASVLEGKPRRHQRMYKALLGFTPRRVELIKPSDDVALPARLPTNPLQMPSDGVAWQRSALAAHLRGGERKALAGAGGGGGAGSSVGGGGGGAAAGAATVGEDDDDGDDTTPPPPLNPQRRSFRWEDAFAWVR